MDIDLDSSHLRDSYSYRSHLVDTPSDEKEALESFLRAFLFTLHDQQTALDFVSVLDLLGILSSSNTGETGKLELKPFLTILGTRIRANRRRVRIRLRLRQRQNL